MAPLTLPRLPVWHADRRLWASPGSPGRGWLLEEEGLPGPLPVSGGLPALARGSADESRLEQVCLEGCTSRPPWEALLLPVFLFITHRQPFPENPGLSPALLIINTKASLALVDVLFPLERTQALG